MAAIALQVAPAAPGAQPPFREEQIQEAQGAANRILARQNERIRQLEEYLRQAQQQGGQPLQQLNIELINARQQNEVLVNEVRVATEELQRTRVRHDQQAQALAVMERGRTDDQQQMVLLQGQLLATRQELQALRQQMDQQAALLNQALARGNALEGQLTQTLQVLQQQRQFYDRQKADNELSALRSEAANELRQAERGRPPYVVICEFAQLLFNKFTS
jgi:hypothetical protein